MLVAVSGGADSTALALLLADARVGPLYLAHVQHGFRPAAADAERALVAALAERIGATLHIVRLEPFPRAIAAGRKIPESWARRRRYEELATLARRCGVRVIATGHHLADQRETQLLHLLRGGALHGLRGMADCRPLDELRLWRPLLRVDPASLRALLRERGVAWIDDPSNGDLRLARNRIRHRLLPELRSAADPLVARLDRLGELATRALTRIDARLSRRLDAAVPTASAGLLLYRRTAIAAVPAPLLAVLFDQISRRVGIGRAQRRRHGELDEAARWLAAGERGTQQVGELVVLGSADWIGFARSTGSAEVRWTFVFRSADDGADHAVGGGVGTGPNVGADAGVTGAGNVSPSDERVWVPPQATLELRSLQPGDRLKERAGALPWFERRYWPALLVDSKLAWVPKLWHAESVSMTRQPHWRAVVVRGLPDLHARAT